MPSVGSSDDNFSRWMAASRECQIIQLKMTLGEFPKFLLMCQFDIPKCVITILDNGDNILDHGDNIRQALSANLFVIMVFVIVAGCTEGFIMTLLL